MKNAAILFATLLALTAALSGCFSDHQPAQAQCDTLGRDLLKDDAEWTRNFWLPSDPERQQEQIALAAHMEYTLKRIAVSDCRYSRTEFAPWNQLGSIIFNNLH